MGPNIVEIVYASTIEEALKAAEDGFEPVECAFGNDSVVGRLVLDHHGKFSAEEPVSIKAAKLAREGERVSRFVVTGTADCHMFEQLNRTYTMVDAEKNIDSIFEALRKRRLKLVTEPLPFFRAMKIITFIYFKY